MKKLLKTLGVALLMFVICFVVTTIITVMVRVFPVASWIICIALILFLSYIIANK